MSDLRCESHTLFGRLVDGKLEVACKNRRCKGERDEVVRHYFNVMTGELLYTKRFREPQAMFAQRAKTPQRVSK
jgi:hypothetical protein